MENNTRREADRAQRRKEADFVNSLENWKLFSTQKFDESSARMSAIEKSLHENTRITELQSKKLSDTQDSVKEVLDVVTTIKGGKTLLGWAGKLFIWAGSLAAAWAAISSAIHGEIKFPWQ